MSQACIEGIPLCPGHVSPQQQGMSLECHLWTIPSTGLSSAHTDWPARYASKDAGIFQVCQPGVKSKTSVSET